MGSIVVRRHAKYSSSALRPSSLTIGTTFVLSDARCSILDDALLNAGHVRDTPVNRQAVVDDALEQATVHRRGHGLSRCDPAQEHQRRTEQCPHGKSTLRRKIAHGDRCIYLWPSHVNSG